MLATPPPALTNMFNMADLFKACSVEGCNKNAHRSANGRSGYCCGHYGRTIRGVGIAHPLGTEKGAALSFLISASESKSCECIVWPFARHKNGYGMITRQRKKHYVHRAVCEIVHGSPPGDGRKIHAAHSCGNGHLGCCNGSHLRWATVAENANDRAIHGTKLFGESVSGARLTIAEIFEIRALRNKMTQQKIADTYKVSLGTINDIFCNRTWTWL